MNNFPFDQIRQGLPGCPSDVKLWRLHCGEIALEESLQLRSHVSGCAECRRRMQQWALARDLLPDAEQRKYP
jgi:hypothetical protein